MIFEFNFLAAARNRWLPQKEDLAAAAQPAPHTNCSFRAAAAPTPPPAKEKAERKPVSLSPTLLRVMEDGDVEGSHSATTFSNKLASLLSFLDDLQNTDSCNELSSNYDGREMFGVTSSHVACTGPAVIKNSANTARLGEEEERDKDLHDCVVPSTKTSSSSKSLLTREKIYIWDEWEETVQDGAMVLLDIDRHMAPGDDPKEYTKSNLMPADARQQLQLLKAMSEEVQTRASSMKIELDYKTKKVEELHALRVKTESDHVQRMKSMKQEWKTRLEDAKAERDEVRVCPISFGFGSRF